MKSDFTPPIGKITQINGQCISLIGNDIDTDRIIPARFLKCVDFDSLGESVFKDDRETLKGRHPFDLEENKNATILIVNSKDNKFLILEIDLKNSLAKSKEFTLNLEIKKSSRKMFLSGEWDATSTLLENEKLIENKFNNLLYLKFNSQFL